MDGAVSSGVLGSEALDSGASGRHFGLGLVSMFPDVVLELAWVCGYKSLCFLGVNAGYIGKGVSVSLLGNLIWIVFGGFFMALGWLLCGLILLVSIIGIPWARSCFTMAQFSFAPFGKTVVKRSEVTGVKGLGEGNLALLGNVIWFIFFGIWLAIGHLFAGLFLCCTIIGIPFGIQHFKLAFVALAPIGQTVVDK